MHALTAWEGFNTQILLILYPHKKMVFNWVSNKWNMVNNLDERKKQRQDQITDEACAIYQVIFYRVLMCFESH